MPTLLARCRALPLILAALLVLAGCNQNVNTPDVNTPDPGDAAKAGRDAANTGFDKATEWSTAYPKFIAGLVVFVVVMYFGRKLISNPTVRVVVAFAIGAFIVYFAMKG